MIKKIQQLGMERKYFHIIRDMYAKPTVNITLNNEYLNSSPLSLDIRQKCLLFPLLFNTVLKIPVREVRQEKENSSNYKWSTILSGCR